MITIEPDTKFNHVIICGCFDGVNGRQGGFVPMGRVNECSLIGHVTRTKYWGWRLEEVRVFPQHLNIDALNFAAMVEYANGEQPRSIAICSHLEGAEEFARNVE